MTFPPNTKWTVADVDRVIDLVAKRYTARDIAIIMARPFEDVDRLIAENRIVVRSEAI